MRIEEKDSESMESCRLPVAIPYQFQRANREVFIQKNLADRRTSFEAKVINNVSRDERAFADAGPFISYAQHVNPHR